MAKKEPSCSIDGVYYKSEKIAAKTLGIATETIRWRLLSPSFPDYTSKYYPKKSGKKRLFACNIAGVKYRSITSASKELELSPYEIKYRLASVEYPDYVCDGIPKEPSKNRRGKNKKPCTVDGINYESEYAAARVMGINITALRSRFCSSNFPGYTSKYHAKVKRRKMLSKKIRCSIKGVEYVSVSAAARKLKTGPTTIFKRLRSFDFPDYVCADIPKVSEPPKERKYSYTVDGKKYRTLQEIADVEGLTRERIRQKMNDSSYTKYQRSERAQSHKR